MENLIIIITGAVTSIISFVLGMRYMGKLVIREFGKPRIYPYSRSYSNYGRGCSYNKRRYNYNDYIIGTKEDADNTIEKLIVNAEKYNFVTVADYYDLIGVPSQYTDNAIGWNLETIQKAVVISTHRGFTISFPPVEVR